MDQNEILRARETGEAVDLGLGKRVGVLVRSKDSIHLLTDIRAGLQRGDLVRFSLENGPYSADEGFEGEVIGVMAQPSRFTVAPPEFGWEGPRD